MQTVRYHVQIATCCSMYEVRDEESTEERDRERLGESKSPPTLEFSNVYLLSLLAL